MKQQYFAEFIGTFIMVFAGTAAIVVNDINNGVITHLGIAIAFGLVVTGMIYALGDISGAHINPAVSLAFWMARRFPTNELLPYVSSQISGAICASLLVYLLFPDHNGLGATQPAGTLVQSLLMEIILSFMLMLTIINVATGAKEKGIMAGVAIGGVVALCALFGGPVSGASMNPARSIGPALVSGQLTALWIYIIGPVIGMGLAILCCRCVREKECCRPSSISH
ncbi:MAG: MIP family channel protein [Gammaproteobacteria bacterium]|nr:MIP family channel protein [Gammaproteobacteria bacterium]MDH5653509.1 MIP family channel protein [Gammaproteobacteria bacterium]